MVFMKSAGTEVGWYAQEADAVVAAAESNRLEGLTSGEADERRSEFGANEIASAPALSPWAIALTQFKDLMNLMLIAVAVVSIVIGEVPTAIVVAVLVGLNVVLGTRQELKARNSIDALAKMHTPQARVIRDQTLCNLDLRSWSQETSFNSRPGTSCRPTAGS